MLGKNQILIFMASEWKLMGWRHVKLLQNVSEEEIIFCLNVGCKTVIAPKIASGVVVKDGNYNCWILPEKILFSHARKMNV